ncbi:MAG: Holliday junction DNA helicase RuvA [Myxococcota bacterium]|jgi:Holliday junction DNA helicase RuvA
MIALLRGTVVHREQTRGIVDVRGVGYEVFAPSRSFDAWGDGEVTVWVSTQVREDAFTLYGFGSDEDRAAFRVLLGVKGVGPKAALAILDTLAVGELAAAVESDDVRTLSKPPGIGRRTAQRLALELKGKLPLSFLPSGERAPAPARAPADPLPLALAQLDYGKSEIDRALAGLEARGIGVDTPLPQRLGSALTILSGS